MSWGISENASETDFKRRCKALIIDKYSKYNGQTIEGYFLQWATKGNTEVIFPVALIELDNGDIVEVFTEHFKFINTI